MRLQLQHLAVIGREGGRAWGGRRGGGTEVGGRIVECSTFNIETQTSRHATIWASTRILPKWTFFQLSKKKRIWAESGWRLNLWNLTRDVRI